MKAFALILFCVVAAAQGRSAVIDTSRDVIVRPWVVHLRVAIGTSGLLNSCAGSFINERWVMTSAGCVNDARFIWVRFNAPNVFQPELVLEVSWTAAGGTLIQRHPQYDAATGANDIALLNMNRVVEVSSSITPIPIIAEDSYLPASGAACGYGEEDDSADPGENLKCYDVDVIAVSEAGTFIGHSEVGEATIFDLGAPLAADGVQFGILSIPQGNEATFINPAAYREWIRATTDADI